MNLSNCYKIIIKLKLKTKKDKDIISWKEIAAAIRRFISRNIMGEIQNNYVHENNLLEYHLREKNLWRKDFVYINNLEELINEKISKYKITVGQALNFYEIIGDDDKNSIIPLTDKKIRNIDNNEDKLLDVDFGL